MGLMDRLLPWRSRAATVVDVPAVAADALLDLPLRRDVAGQDVALRQSKTQEAILALGSGLDADDALYRRLTGNGKTGSRRDLTPIQQDRMLEISWFLWEQNPFAKRLITVMTDLILGEGVTVQATDERVQVEVNLTWNHRINQLSTRIREFYNALALNGELVLPAERNPVTGRPVLGYIDPYQVLRVEPMPGNILVPEFVVLKPDQGQTGEGQKLRIIQEDPETGRLEGEVFYFAINRLPNSTRGRSDLLPLADWLDLYDQYLFAEVERLHLLSAFVWDYKIEDADQPMIDAKLKKFPTPKPGAVFAHNQKETLEARTPDLKAQDRTEVARMLRVHIAGSLGFPTTYFGDTDSNRATIEGQNDVAMKTPAARQKEFGNFLNQIVRFMVEGPLAKNPSLFRGADPGWVIRMPEIAAKDVSRVGTVLSSVVTAMDTGMSNKTISRRVAVTTTLALLKHLGVEADPQEVMDEADLDAEDRQAMADEIQAGMAAKRSPGLEPEDDGEDPEDEGDGGGGQPKRGAAQEGRGQPLVPFGNAAQLSVERDPVTNLVTKIVEVRRAERLVERDQSGRIVGITQQ